MSDIGIETDTSSHLFTCERQFCQLTSPSCCIQLTPNCAGNGESKQWFHLTNGEHFCLACYTCITLPTSLTPNELIDLKIDWHRRWLTHASVVNGLPLTKEFFSLHHLPMWLLCCHCHHWRCIFSKKFLQKEFKMQEYANFVKKFTCNQLSSLNDDEEEEVLKKNSPQDCLMPENEIIPTILANGVDDFLGGIYYDIYLRTSPAQAFLTFYPLDLVGIAPSTRFQPEDDDNNNNNNHHPTNQNQSILNKNVEIIEKNLSHSSIISHPPKPPGVPNYFQPFLMPNESPKFGSICPMTISPSESHYFHNYTKCSKLFLAIRNLIISLWYRSPCTWLSPDDVCIHVNLCGLIRVIVCNDLVPNLIRFLTFEGQINIGCLSLYLNPTLSHALFQQRKSNFQKCRQLPIKREDNDDDEEAAEEMEIDPPKASSSSIDVLENHNLRIVVIGGGLAGITAARHLATFGHQVTLLESKSILGGSKFNAIEIPTIKNKALKSQEQISLGTGISFVDFSVNNPLTLLAHQAAMKCEISVEKHCLFYFGGDPFPEEICQQAELFVQNLLNTIQMKENDEVNESTTTSLQEVFDLEMKNEDFDKNFLAAVEHFLAQLEFLMTGGIQLNNLSYSSWCKPIELNNSSDINSIGLPLEPSIVLHQVEEKEEKNISSWQQVISHWVDEIGKEKDLQDVDKKDKVRLKQTVWLNRRVKSIQFPDEDIEPLYILTEDDEFDADVALLALPLHDFQQIQLSPALDEKRCGALERLCLSNANNHHITVTLVFSRAFWNPLFRRLSGEESKTMSNSKIRCFSALPESRSTRGFCFLFYDYSLLVAPGAGHVLQTRICGEAVQDFVERSDAEVVHAVLHHLHCLCYADDRDEIIVIHKPRWSNVHRWRQSCTAQPIGSEVDDWITFGEKPLKNRLYFCLPDFQNHFSSSLTGSFQSGLRAAQNILRQHDPRFLNCNN